MTALRGSCKRLDETFRHKLRASAELRLEFCKFRSAASSKQQSRCPWVAVRVRPEKALRSLQVNGRRSLSMDAETIVVPHAESRASEAKSRARFYFDHAFDASATQTTVWRALREPLEHCIVSRKHACVLAYGQTGSGKTHTMFGDQTHNPGISFRMVRSVAALLKQPWVCRPDLVPPTITLSREGFEIIGSCLSGSELVRVPFIPSMAGHLCGELTSRLGIPAGRLKLFQEGQPVHDAMLIDPEEVAAIVAKHHLPEHDQFLESYDVPMLEFSFLEIYNEGVYDLLADGCQLPLVRESAKAIVPRGTTKLRCSPNEVESELSRWLQLGADSRTTGQTAFNDRSSRSHAVATIYFNWGPKSQSRIYLVDLAGSERAGKYHVSEEQLREGNNINHGLSSLARVISSIANGKGDHVPSRDSALTWLLADAIAGKNSKAFMLAAVNPESPLETLSTLKYAEQFSTLQAKGGADVARLGKAMRGMESERKMLLAEIDETCSKCQMPAGWSKAMLGMETVRPCKGAEAMIRAHPRLDWTEQHCLVSGKPGYVKKAVHTQARTSSQASTVAGLSGLPPPVAGAPAALRTDELDDTVEVVFERRKGVLVVRYPRGALEDVQPPRYLQALSEKATRILALERKLADARCKLKTLRDACQGEHQRLAGLC